MEVTLSKQSILRRGERFGGGPLKKPRSGQPKKVKKKRLEEKARVDYISTWH
jgi:hypothetical protein